MRRTAKPWRVSKSEAARSGLHVKAHATSNRAARGPGRRSAVQSFAPGAISTDASSATSTSPYPGPDRRSRSTRARISRQGRARRTHSISESVRSRGAGGVPQARSPSTIGCVRPSSRRSRSTSASSRRRKWPTRTDVSIGSDRFRPTPRDVLHVRCSAPERCAPLRRLHPNEGTHGLAEELRLVHVRIRKLQRLLIQLVVDRDGRPQTVSPRPAPGRRGSAPPRASSGTPPRGCPGCRSAAPSAGNRRRSSARADR